MVKIGKNAFYKAPITMLSIPDNVYIGTKAFGNCSNLRTIDLSTITSISAVKWEPNIFDNVKCSDGETKGTIYVYSNKMIEQWKEYFSLNESNTDLAEWNFKVINDI